MAVALFYFIFIFKYLPWSIWSIQPSSDGVPPLILKRDATQYLIIDAVTAVS